ncbi:hypothetical protein UlMin_038223 [Ulmus minor]
MHRKSETFDKFKEFRVEVENQLGVPIKSLWFDRGGEYLSDEFQQHLLENEIVYQLTAPGTPRQNDVVKRRNRTLLDMVRSMMRVLTSVKAWLAKQFDMKDLGEANFILVFTFGGGTIVWRSIKQSCIVDSTMEAEYVAATEASKEVVWLRKFLSGLEVIPGMERLITLYCDNMVAIVNTKDSRHHKRTCVGQVVLCLLVNMDFPL